MTRLRCRIDGRVQGVGFRAATAGEARALGLGGWVRNLDDGAVELWAEGPAEALERLLGWARRGPAGSRVTAVDAEWGPLAGDEPARGFTIRRDLGR